jgi:hypothetical protein
MSYKISILFYICLICNSVSAQELQSPQISQQAIFANPGLAGQMGYTRIAASLSTYKSSNYYKDFIDMNHSYETIKKRSFNNGLISADGLILKKRLGIGGYFKSETFERIDTDNFFQNSTYTNSANQKYSFSNIYMGLMLAPKFQLPAKNENRQAHVLSPALAIGFKGTQFDYSGATFYNYAIQDSTRSGVQNKSFGLEYVSASLLYSSATSYSGIKLNFQNYIHAFVLYDVSFLYSKTYSNKNVTEPRFSFTHQFQLTVPTYQFFNYNRYSTYFDQLNKNNLMNYFITNLDFKYDNYILGTFVGFNDFDGVYAGITGGIQLERMKIMVNYSPRFSSKKYGSSGLFVSANFYLKKK